MAGSRKTPSRSSDYVDISSNTQLVSVYKKKGRAKRIIALVVAIVFMVCGTLLIVGCGVVNSTLDLYTYDDLEDVTVATDSTVETTDEIDDFDNVVSDSDLLSDSKILNVMLFGEDNHSSDSTGRSDTMIMASIDNRTQKIKLTSFQRDTYVYVPGYGNTKLTHAYSYGGASLAIKTIETNFGIKIDRYAVVDFDSFKEIIDVLGGVTMNITAEEAGYINLQLYLNNQASDRNTLEEVDGKVKLNGQQALWYARNRGYSEYGYSGDDWDRTKRQRKLLKTVFKSLKKASMSQIISIISEVGPLVTTNLKKDEITTLATHALTYVNYEVVQYNIPQDGLWSYANYTDAGSVIVINDMDECRQEFAEFIFEDLITDTD